MKKTESDQLFGRRFADELEPHITKQQQAGKSLEKIAAELGVTGPGMKKQLAGGTPSVRTVALAFRQYRVAVPYEDVDVASVLTGKRSPGAANQKDHRPRQLRLPFEISSPRQATSMKITVRRKGPTRYELDLTIKMAK